MAYKDKEKDRWYPSAGFLYLIRYGEEDIYKIGITRDSPKSRMAALQTACPYKLTLAAYAPVMNVEEIEATAHKLVEHCRMMGEWFRLDEDKVGRIKWLMAVEGGYHERKVVFLHACGLFNALGTPRVSLPGDKDYIGVCDG